MVPAACLTCATHGAYAQSPQDINPLYGTIQRVETPLMAKPSNGPVVPKFEHPDALFEDPMGLGSWLRHRGIAVLLSNTNEFAGAITKPTPGFMNYRQGSSNAGQFSTVVHLNWEKLVGLKGFATHTVFTSRYGTTANRMLGDWLGHASEIYGGGGNVVVHLVMAYGEENLYGGRLAIAGGRMTESADFSASNLFCNFQNNSMCGRPKSFTDNPYVAAYPAGEWGFRMRGRPTRYTYVQTGVYFAENGIYQNAQHRTGFKFNGANIKGQIAPVELGWEPSFGPRKALPGHYKIGAQLISAPTADNFYDTRDRPYAATRKSAMQHDKTWNAWLEADQKIYAPPKGGSDAGTTLMSGFVYNNKRTALREWEFYVGAINRGYIPGRPYDAINVIVSYTKIAPGVSATDAIFLQEGRARFLPNHATGIQSYATIVEANYQYRLLRGAFLSPDCEVYVNPNGQKNLRTGVFMGINAKVQIF